MQKAMIDPEVTDEFGREAMTVVARTTSLHALSLAVTNSSEQKP
jgi:hypothetical protein